MVLIFPSPSQWECKVSIPLKQWFDITKKIDKYELANALDQMELYAVKQGDVSNDELRTEQRKMKLAVRAHNKAFTTC